MVDNPSEVIQIWRERKKPSYLQNENDIGAN